MTTISTSRLCYMIGQSINDDKEDDDDDRGKDCLPFVYKFSFYCHKFNWRWKIFSLTLFLHLQSTQLQIYCRSGPARSPGTAMLAAAEANRLSIINSIKLTMDGQYVVIASLCGPPQIRDVMVSLCPAQLFPLLLPAPMTLCDWCCLAVILSVSRITEKVMSRFHWNFVLWLHTA